RHRGWRIPDRALPDDRHRATVAWRNMNTGAAGEYRVPILAGFYGSEHYALFQDTGPGHIVVTVYTDMPNIPAQSAFDVPG
ncbi:hypothetical protein ACWELQ_14255, partial [Nocardia sp. NPDC004722]